MNEMTEKQAKALNIIKDNPGIRAREFSEKMWPDGPHRRSKNGGNGSQVGKGMWLCAGSYFAKLRKDGLITSVFGNVREQKITGKGIELLGAYNLKIPGK